MKQYYISALLGIKLFYADYRGKPDNDTTP